MNDQVLEASILILSPQTSSEQRQHATQNLESFLSSPQQSTRFETYIDLLHILFFTNTVEQRVARDHNVTSTGIKLLFLSMLHNQCRRVGTKVNDQELVLVLRNLLGKVYSCLNNCSDTALVSSLCSVTSAVAVRKGGIKELIFQASTTTTPVIGYKLLISLSQELETQVSFDKKEIERHDIKLSLLQKVYNGIICGDVLALQVLSKWVPLLSITLSQLYEYNNSHNPPPSPISNQQHGSNLLYLLIHILSNNNNNAISDQMIIHSANAISESILLSMDNGTPTRTQSISLLLESMSKQGFILYPFTTSHKDNDDVAHALSNLSCNLAIEEVDTITKCTNVGCNKLIELLFHMQMHKSVSVSMLVLEVWLTFQDIPTSERHESMTFSLFSKLLDVLVQRISYPQTFTSWDESDIDCSDFEQFRKLVRDVLISIYFLLRGNFLNQLYQLILTSSTNNTMKLWNILESSLFCLSCISSEVHSRLKNSVPVEDCSNTSKVLLSILEMCCFSEQQSANINVLLKQHPTLLLSLVTFLGSYASLWNICNDIDSNIILQILNFLQKILVEDQVTDLQLVNASSKAITNIFIACSDKIVILDLDTVVLPILVHFMQYVVNTVTNNTTSTTSSNYNNDAILTITEGIVRLLVKYPNDVKVHQAMISISSPILQKSNEALNYIQTSNSTQMEIACLLLERYLSILEIIIKFCEVSSQEQHPLTELFNSLVWPFLSSSIPICRQNHTLFGQILSVNGQILSSVPHLISPYISELITFVVQSYEEMYYPSALDFIATTLESSCIQGSSTEQFSLLLSHVLKCTCYYVTTHKHPTDCPQLIYSFFDLCKRFLVFSPMVLYHCSDLPTLFSFAVACLKGCNGQIESTRATLNFLNQIMSNSHGRKDETNGVFVILEPLVLNDGQVITNFCISGLVAGDMPQILQPSLADCLVSLLSFIVMHCNNNGNHSATPSDPIETLYIWISLSLKEINNIEPDHVFLFEQILLSMLKQKRNSLHLVNGNKKKVSRQSMKMLFMDFSKICKGEISHDCLLSYSMNGTN